MMQVVPCSGYRGKSEGCSLLAMPDGKSFFKVYYVSILGRDKPEVFEWSRCSLTKPGFEETFRRSGREGVGFVTAFPHVTKVFRFCPKVETVMDVAGFHTVDMKPRGTDRGDGFDEFACYAEAVIAAEEYHAWASARSVQEYLRARCAVVEFPVVSNTKLLDHWGK